MSQKNQRLTFISYSRANKEFAVKLARELRSAGFNIWLDQLDIPAGARWDDEVERALEACDIFMVILTPASSTSDNVKDEIGYAIDSGKQIFPILLKDANVPLRLRRFQYVDFTSKSFDDGIESAKSLLGKLVDEPTASKEQSPEQVQQTSSGTGTQETPAVRQVSVGADQKSAQRPSPAQSSPAQQDGSIGALLKKNPKLLPVLGAVGALVVIIIAIVIISGLSQDPEYVSAQAENPPAEITADLSSESVAQPAEVADDLSSEAPAEPAAQPPGEMGAPSIETIGYESQSNDVLFESFDNNENGWFTGSDATGEKYVEDGTYIWEVQLEDGTDAWQLFGEDISISDFELSVDIRRNGGTPSNLCYGIIFRATEEEISGIMGYNTGEHYDLVVCDDQSYLISYYDGNDWIYFRDWTESASIHTNDWNTLTVEAIGDEFSYYINDTLIAEFSDSNLDVGSLGFTAISYEGTVGQVLFDNVEVHLLEP